jgi:hypothetical protein
MNASWCSAITTTTSDRDRRTPCHGSTVVASEPWDRSLDPGWFCQRQDEATAAQEILDFAGGSVCNWVRHHNLRSSHIAVESVAWPALCTIRQGGARLR